MFRWSFVWERRNPKALEAHRETKERFPGKKEVKVKICSRSWKQWSDATYAGLETVLKELFMVFFFLRSTLKIYLRQQLYYHIWGSTTSFIFRVALGILKYGSEVLETQDFEECLTWLTHLSANLDEKALFSCIKSISLSKKKLEELMAKYNLECD